MQLELPTPTVWPSHEWLLLVYSTVLSGVNYHIILSRPLCTLEIPSVDGHAVVHLRLYSYTFFLLTHVGEKMDADTMDEKRKEHMAYEYLCHLEEAKQ